MSNEESNLITLTVEHPDEALFRLSASLLEMAESYTITNPEMAVNAGEELKEIKALYKDLEKKRTGATQPINQALREINGWFKPAKQWLKDAEGLLKTKLLKYQAEQDRIAQEAQRKIDEEAEQERKRLEKAAALAAQAGMDERAEELREEVEVQQEELQQAPVIKSAAPKIEGIVTKTTWKAEVTDKLLFVKHVASTRPDLIALIQINQSALNGQARSLKGSLDLPGIRVYEEKNIAARS